MIASSRIRAGIWTLPVGGVLGAAGVLLRGPNGVPLVNADAWAQAAGTGQFLIGQLLLIAAFVLPFIGFWALYAFLRDTAAERGAFWGFMFSVIGTALAMPALGIAAFAGPPAAALYLQDDTAAAQLISDALTGTGLMVGLVSGILYTLGPLLSGIALWRSGTAAKWAVVLFGVHGVLLSFGFGFFPVLVTGWLLLAAGGAGLAWAIRRL